MENVISVNGILLSEANKDIQLLGRIRDDYLTLAVENDSSSCWEIATILSKAQSDVVNVIGATYE